MLCPNSLAEMDFDKRKAKMIDLRETLKEDITALCSLDKVYVHVMMEDLEKAILSNLLGYIGEFKFEEQKDVQNMIAEIGNLAVILECALEIRSRFELNQMS